MPRSDQSNRPNAKSWCRFWWLKTLVWVDRDQSIELANALARAGAEHQLVLLPGIGHTFDLEKWSGKPLPLDVRAIVLKFLDRHLV